MREERKKIGEKGRKIRKGEREREREREEEKEKKRRES